MIGRAGSVTRTEAGYSLLEVLVAIGILALMTSAVLASWPAHFRDRLDVVSEHLRVSLAAARDAAMRTNLPKRVEFDVAGRSWAGFDGRRYSIPEEIRIEVTGARPTANGQDIGITFMPQGSSTGGAIGLSHGAGRVEITVDWLTSRIAVKQDD